MFNLKRIIIVNASPLPSVGGIQTFTTAIAQEFRKLQYEIVLISTTQNKKDFESTYQKNKIFRLRAKPFLDGKLPLPIKLKEICMVIEKEFIKKEKALVIIQARFYPMSVLFAFIAKCAKYPCIIIDHGAAHMTLENKNLEKIGKWYEHIITKLEKMCEAEFYAVSEESAQWLKHFNIKTEKIFSNGTNFKEKKKRKEEKDTKIKVVFCGRLLVQKGVLEAIEGFRKIEKEHPEKYFLKIVGGGPLEKELRQRTRNEKNILIVGPVTHKKAIEELEKSDIVLSPSIWPEGFCTTALEAGALGKAVIATKYGIGKSLTQSNKTVILLKDTEPETIANALLELENREKRDDIGENLKREVDSKFIWKTIVEKFIKEQED